MNSLGKRTFSPLSLVLFTLMLAGCSSPPPPPPPTPPPPLERTCETSQSTEVVGDMRGDGQVTRVTELTRCITQ